MSLATIREIIAHHTGIDAAQVKNMSDFRQDLGIDSLDIFEIIMELEEKFKIEIPTEDLEDMKKVSDLVEYIDSRLEK